jgi:GxxExxY protein
MKPNELTREVIGSAIEVHRELGPGKHETAYERALAYELRLRSIPHEVQKPVPVIYKEVHLECGYRLDLLVADTVVIEVKSVELVHPIHRAQVLTYLKLGDWKLSLLLNFNVAVLKDGIERLVLGFEESPRETAETRCAQRIPDEAVLPQFHSSCQGSRPEVEALARQIIAAAAEVHRELGIGLLPSAYQACLAYELRLRGLEFEQKCALALGYKGMDLTENDTLDFLVGGRVVVKIICAKESQALHRSELLSQLRLGSCNLGLLINFNVTNFSDGVHRLVYTPAN